MALKEEDFIQITFRGQLKRSGIAKAIGCGKALADIVQSKAIANIRLDIVKRQKGSTGIPEYAKLINEGVDPPSTDNKQYRF